MKLHIYEHCPFCCRALMIRGLKRLDLPVAVIMEGDAETPTRMIGKKMVPILEKPDGTCMGESLDIVRYLDAAFPPPVITAPPLPAVDDWCRQASGTIFKLCVPRFTRAEFAELATPEARAAYTERETRAFGDLPALLDATPALLAELAPRLEALEAIVPAAEAAIGESDFQLLPLLRSLRIVRGLTFGPKVQAYYAAMLARTGLDDFAAKAL